MERAFLYEERPDPVKKGQIMEFLTVRDVAQQLHVSQRRAYELMAARVIPSVRLGGRIVVPRPAFDAWCEAQVSKALERCREDVRRAG